MAPTLFRVGSRVRLGCADAEAAFGFTDNFTDPSTLYTNGLDSHLDLAASQFLNQQQAELAVRDRLSQPLERCRNVLKNSGSRRQSSRLPPDSERRKRARARDAGYLRLHPFRAIRAISDKASNSGPETGMGMWKTSAITCSQPCRK